MNPLLEPAGRKALAEFARRHTLIAFDYDGTLAPIVPEPADAHMRPATRDLLSGVCRRFPVIVLTGRARADALRFLGGVGVLEVIGSHGLETPGTAIARFARRVERWRAQLTERLRSLRGVKIEDKRFSLAVHYRLAADPAVARERIEHETAGLEGARLLGGKKVINVVPQEAPDKGTALHAACDRWGCARAVYVGDDETDEDVFALRQPERIFTVRVGRRAASAASYFLGGQDEVDEFLRVLVELA